MVMTRRASLMAIISFILMPWMLDSARVLCREISCWLLLGFKGLRKFRGSLFILFQLNLFGEKQQENTCWYCIDIVRRNSVWSLMRVKGLISQVYNHVPCHKQKNSCWGLLLWFHWQFHRQKSSFHYCLSERKTIIITDKFTRIKDFRCMSENLLRKSHWNQGGEKEYLVFW